jgi:hypothetical protein
MTSSFARSGGFGVVLELRRPSPHSACPHEQAPTSSPFGSSSSAARTTLPQYALQYGA